MTETELISKIAELAEELSLNTGIGVKDAVKQAYVAVKSQHETKKQTPEEAEIQKRKAFVLGDLQSFMFVTGVCLNPQEVEEVADRYMEGNYNHNLSKVDTIQSIIDAIMDEKLELKNEAMETFAPNPELLKILQEDVGIPISECIAENLMK